METNRGTIVLAERTVDIEKHRSVLRDWGYAENEIQRFLKQSNKRQELAQRQKSRVLDAAVPDRVQANSL